MVLGIIAAFIVTVIVLALLFGIMLYNDLVSKRTHAEEGWSGIDVALKRRYDLIPNLVSTVKGYTEHEQRTLEKIIELRARCGQSTSRTQRAENEEALTGMLKNLFALAEAYPDLKANANFIELQKTLNEIEDNVSMARRYYNATVRDLNILVQSFPSNIIAKRFGFSAMEFFEIRNSVERDNIEVSF